MGVIDDRNAYIGKLNSKKDHSIGVYHRQGSGPPVMALGGHEYSSYDIRRISLLVHWDKDVRASERAAYELYEKLKNVSSLSIGIHPLIASSSRYRNRWTWGRMIRVSTNM
ncbi:MAG: hypothetical protein ACLTW9_17160 [Enterocloster sp.]